MNETKRRVGIERTRFMSGSCVTSIISRDTLLIRYSICDGNSEGPMWNTRFIQQLLVSERENNYHSPTTSVGILEFGSPFLIER